MHTHCCNVRTSGHWKERLESLVAIGVAVWEKLNSHLVCASSNVKWQRCTLEPVNQSWFNIDVHTSGNQPLGQTFSDTFCVLDAEKTLQKHLDVDPDSGRVLTTRWYCRLPDPFLTIFAIFSHKSPNMMLNPSQQWHLVGDSPYVCSTRFCHLLSRVSSPCNLIICTCSISRIDSNIVAAGFCPELNEVYLDATIAVSCSCDVPCAALAWWIWWWIHGRDDDPTRFDAGEGNWTSTLAKWSRNCGLIESPNKSSAISCGGATCGGIPFSARIITESCSHVSASSGQ